MLREVVFFCVFIAIVNCQSTQVSQCTSNSGALPINTYIVGCDVPPCSLPQLQDVVVNIVFRAPRTLKSMTTLATAYLSVGFITIPIPYDLGENSVTCNFLQNSYCPVIEDEVVMYQLRMFIEETFPVGTSAAIEFRVVGETQSGESYTDNLFCLRANINIVAAVPSVTNRNTTNIDLE